MNVLQLLDLFLDDEQITADAVLILFHLSGIKRNLHVINECRGYPRVFRVLQMPYLRRHPQLQYHTLGVLSGLTTHGPCAVPIPTLSPSPILASGRAHCCATTDSDLSLSLIMIWQTCGEHVKTRSFLTRAGYDGPCIGGVGVNIEFDRRTPFMYCFCLAIVFFW